MAEIVTPPLTPTVDPVQVARFDAAGEDWWNPHGDARWLHRYNPLRVAYIADAACRQFGAGTNRADPLHGRRILDIGCGAGILSESLAQLGAEVVGADPSPFSIEVAGAHARQQGLAIDYRRVTAEALVAFGERFDAVLAMEVVEHVAEPALFLRCCAELVKPGGLMILSTINRTFKSFAYVIVAAEYILRLLPRGAHQWRRFVTPQEMRTWVEASGLTVSNVTGVTFNLSARAMEFSRDTSVNYIMAAGRARH